MIADSMSEAEVVAAYPDLKAEDVREAIRYAADAVRERESWDGPTKPSG